MMMIHLLLLLLPFAHSDENVEAALYQAANELKGCKDQVVYDMDGVHMPVCCDKGRHSVFVDFDLRWEVCCDDDPTVKGNKGRRVKKHKEGEPTEPRRMAVYWNGTPNRRWPNAFIPFIVNSNAHDRGDAIHWAIKELHANTNLRVGHRNGDTYYMDIDDSGTCSAPGGVGLTGNEKIYIGTCGTGSVLHEMLHVAGFKHTHGRSDRNNYITVSPGAPSQYDIYSGSDWANYGPYDYDSIMHYGPGGGIITPPPGKSIGQRTHISTNDKNAVNHLYPSAEYKAQCLNQYYSLGYGHRFGLWGSNNGRYIKGMGGGSISVGTSFSDQAHFAVRIKCGSTNYWSFITDSCKLLKMSFDGNPSADGTNLNGDTEFKRGSGGFYRAGSPKRWFKVNSDSVTSKTSSGTSADIDLRDQDENQFSTSTYETVYCNIASGGGYEPYQPGPDEPEEWVEPEYKPEEPEEWVNYKPEEYVIQWTMKDVAIYGLLAVNLVAVAVSVWRCLRKDGKGNVKYAIVRMADSEDEALNAI